VIPLATLRELYDYNYWACDRQLDACAVLTREQFLRPLGNSFPSVRDTLVHLLGAEWIWLERWRGRSPRTLLPANEFPSLAAIRDRWQVVEREVRDYLKDLREESLAVPLTYTNIKGETWTYPLWRPLLHLVNHQSYHRGQITTLLRQLGATPAQVDFLYYQDRR
jgi:uncharacterized damage-inducible protein DinB